MNCLIQPIELCENGSIYQGRRGSLVSLLPSCYLVSLNALRINGALMPFCLLRKRLLSASFRLNAKAAHSCRLTSNISLRRGKISIASVASPLSYFSLCPSCPSSPA